MLILNIFLIFSFFKIVLVKSFYVLHSITHLNRNKYGLRLKLIYFFFFVAEFVTQITLTPDLVTVDHPPPKSTIYSHSLFILYAPLPLYEYLVRENENRNLRIFIIIVLFVSTTAQQIEMLLLFCYLIFEWNFFFPPIILWWAALFCCLLSVFVVVIMVVHKRCVSYARMKISKSNLYLNIVSIDVGVVVVVVDVVYAGRSCCTCMYVCIYAVISKRHVFYMVYCYFSANFWTNFFFFSMMIVMLMPFDGHHLIYIYIYRNEPHTRIDNKQHFVDTWVLSVAVYGVGSLWVYSNSSWTQCGKRAVTLWHQTDYWENSKRNVGFWMVGKFRYPSASAVWKSWHLATSYWSRDIFLKNHSYD